MYAPRDLGTQRAGYERPSPDDVRAHRLASSSTADQNRIAELEAECVRLNGVIDGLRASKKEKAPSKAPRPPKAAESVEDKSEARKAQSRELMRQKRAREREAKRLDAVEF